MTVLLVLLALQNADGKERAQQVIAHNVKTRAWTLEKEDSDLLARARDKEFAWIVSEYLKVKRDSLRLVATRTLILGYLEQGLEIPNMELKAKALGLVKADDRWVTSEGLVVSKIRAGDLKPDAIERLSPPGFEIPYFTAAEILIAAMKTQDQEMAEGLVRAAKAFRPVSGPLKKPADDIRAILEKLKFCKNCQGTCSRPCDYGPCEGGKIVKCCATCNGTGKNPQSYHAPNFQTPCPNPGNNGKHKWVEDCTRCQGSGKMPCKNCKTPWKAPAPADVFDQSPCEFCSGSGWALARVQLPCPSCVGVGSIVRPPKPPPPPSAEK